MDFDVRFESLWDFVEAADKRDKYSSRFDASFTQTSSLSQATKLAKEGWNDIHDKVRLIADGITHAFADRIEERHEMLYDVSGGCVDVGRALMGEPECMITFTAEPVAAIGKVVHVVFNGGVSGIVSTESLTMRGAVCIALIDTLEALGYSTIVDVEVHNQAGGGGVVTVSLKKADEAYDQDAIAYGIAHPSFLRRHYFSWIDGINPSLHRAYSIGTGYGRVGPIVNRGDVNIESRETWEDLEDAKAWVMGMIEGLEAIEV